MRISGIKFRETLLSQMRLKWLKRFRSVKVSDKKIAA